MHPIPQSLLFMKDTTLEGTKKEIYVLLKILKVFTQKKAKSSVDRKVSSYVLKFAIDSVLQNNNPTKEEMGASIRAVLHHKTLRGRFGSVSPALEEEGITRVEVGDSGLHFVRGTHTGGAEGGLNIKQVADEEKEQDERTATIQRIRQVELGIQRTLTV